MTEEKSRIHWIFKKQGSHWEAEMFRLTADLSLDDWRQIRTESYWQKLSRISIKKNPGDYRIAQRLAVTEYLESKEKVG